MKKLLVCFLIVAMLLCAACSAPDTRSKGQKLADRYDELGTSELIEMCDWYDLIAIDSTDAYEIDRLSSADWVFDDCFDGCSSLEEVYDWSIFMTELDWYMMEGDVTGANEWIDDFGAQHDALLKYAAALEERLDAINAIMNIE